MAGWEAALDEYFGKCNKCDERFILMHRHLGPQCGFYWNPFQNSRLGGCSAVPRRRCRRLVRCLHFVPAAAAAQRPHLPHLFLPHLASSNSVRSRRIRLVGTILPTHRTGNKFESTPPSTRRRLQQGRLWRRVPRSLPLLLKGPTLRRGAPHPPYPLRAHRRSLRPT
jgi:hypothetical protein